jgi:hypothetical protein
MKTIFVGAFAVVAAIGLAQAAQTTYAPHQAAGAVRVAFQDISDEPCSQDREVLACVVSLGPSPNDRWAYFLNDSSGQRSDAVRYESKAPGTACAAMAFPVGNVVIAGGSGDWFAGRIQHACRH